jgi:hypothetical protein
MRQMVLITVLGLLPRNGKYSQTKSVIGECYWRIPYFWNILHNAMLMSAMQLKKGKSYST